MTEAYDALVIGGGQAGLAAGYHLQRTGLSFAILEAASDVGGS
jgi:putative flavoprotein involved in K+ transport